MKILKRPSAGGLVGGNATSEDIISGKNAVVNGELVEGSLYIVPAGGTSKTIYGSQYGTIEEDTTNNRIDISRITYSRGAYEAMSYRVMSVPMAEFGDASASDVVSGKTFTSSAGHKVTGTAEGGLKIASGTFSKTTASKRHEVALPFAPKYFFCYAEVTNTSGTGTRAIFADIENESCRFIIGSTSYEGGFAVGSANYLLIYEDAIEIVCQSTHLNPDMGTYHWYALG